MADRSVRVRLSAEVGDYTSKMGQAASATDKVASAAEKAGKASQKSSQTASEGWSTLAGGAAKGGAAVAAVGAVMVKSYMDFDAQMSKVGAATNASAADMGKLRQAAMDAGQEFGQFTSTDAAGALEELGKAGLNTSQSITALSGTMGLAASDGMAVGEAAELTADALNMFGLKGDQATRVANRLAQGAGAASGSAKQLGQGLSQVGAVANQMGVPMDDAVQSLALFAKNGIKGSDAGTSLKTMLMSLANPSKEAAGTMKDLGIQAFDAQGNFKGMRDLAGQLNTKLSGLTTEQKNAALATMFGADAMRVAGVMAKEGASGYDSMGKSMEGFGSASEIAAKKTDNLKGRFAELGGAWENFGIQMGAAADGPLTKAVGGLTSILELASRHPQAAQQIGVAAASLAALGLAGAGVVKTVQGVQAFGSAIKAITGIGKTASAVGDLAGNAGSLGSKSAGAAGGMGKLSTAAAGVGAAMTVAAAGSALIQAQLDKQIQTQEQVHTSMLSMAKGNAEALGKLDADIDAMDFGETNLAEVVKALDGQAGGLAKVTKGFSDFSGVLPGVTSTTENYRTELSKISDSLAAMDPVQAGQAFSQLSSQMQVQGVSAQQLSGHLGSYQAKLNATANALASTVPSFDAATLSASDYAEWMGGKLPASVAAAAAASVRAKDANAGASASMLAAASAAGTLSASIESLPATQRVQIIADAAMAQTTVAGFVSSLQGLPPETIAKLKTTAETKGLDKAKAELRAIKDKQVKVTAKGDPSGATTVKKAVDGVKNKTAKVSSTGDPSGALKVTGAVKAVPNSKTAKVGSTGDTGGADRVKMAVKAVPVSKTATVNTIGNTGGANAARAAVNSVPASKTSVITTIFRQIKQKLGFATGGYVSGSGTGTSDSIEARLSNGEFVVRAAAVRALGVARLDHLNRTGQVPKFATGGLVGAPKFATGGLVQASGQQVTIRIDRVTDYAAMTAAMHSLTRATTVSAGAAQANAREAKAAKAALTARHRIEDADVRARIAATKSPKAKATLRTQKAQLDARQAREMAAATSRATAATAAQAKAQDKAKASIDAYKARQDAAAEAMRKVADNAKAVSDSMAGRYDLGWDAKDSAAIAREGAGEINRLISQIAQLRKLGLSESVIQKIADKGTGQGTEVAASIIAGGKASVAAQNAAAKALQRAADRLGKTVAIGRATGGPVFGAGTANSDSIPAWLSNGEHVWTAREVDALGGHDAMLRLRAAVLGGRTPRFANGGRVGGFSSDVGRYISTSSAMTFAPRYEVHGPDANQVAARVAAQTRHDIRSMAVNMPGG